MTEETPILNFTVSEPDSGKRIDAFLAEHIDSWSRARLQRLVTDGDVLVNEKPVKSSHRIRMGDEIEIELTEVAAAKFEPEDIPLEIVYEDEQLAVVNKPAGMVVHPGAGVHSGTLANALAFHFGMKKTDLDFENSTDEQSRIGNLRSRIGLVHRLDKDTSGLIVIAKNEAVHEFLADQFRNREVFKSYIALAHGATHDNAGKIDSPIARDKHNRTRMKIAQSGRHALSLWKVRKRFEKFTLLDVEIKTGRTHQIRVHLASINHPVAGDANYNEGRDNTVADSKIRHALTSLGRFFLHAEKLSFIHPETKGKMDFVQPLPDELTSFLDIIES